MARQRLNPRKLLVASVGVATMNYLPIGCAESTATVANLMAAPGASGAGGGINLGTGGAADAGRDVDAAPMPSPTVANLLAPAPHPQSVTPAKKGH